MPQQSFWRDVLFAWTKINFKQPSNPSQIAAQSIWFNSLLKSNKKLFWYPAAWSAGIKFIFNLWNPIAHRFLQYNELITIYGNCITFLQYYALIAAIPRKWVLELKNTRHILEDYQYLYENFEGKQSGEVYTKLVSNNNRLSMLQNTWEWKLGACLFQETFCENFSTLYKLVSDTKHQNFQFRYLHRCIFTAKTLFSWGISESPLCPNENCNELETMEHLFYQCPKSKRFWETFISWYEAMTDTEIQLTLETISFCNHENNLVNTLIILAKYHIHSRRIQGRLPNIYILKDTIYETIKIERKNALLTKRYKPFIKKWKALFSVLD